MKTTSAMITVLTTYVLMTHHDVYAVKSKEEISSSSKKKQAPDGTEVDAMFMHDLCPSNGCANTQYAIPKLD